LFFWNSPSDSENNSLIVKAECFNPCFFGTRLRTACLAAIMPLIGQFQSLFFWNSPSDRTLELLEHPDPCVSILVFLELAFGLFRCMSLFRTQLCFNPCFFGTRLRTRNSARYYICGDVSILVFLELAFGPFRNLVPFRLYPSFNPCFFGTRLRTLIAALGCPISTRFQSLFFWNSPSDNNIWI